MIKWLEIVAGTLRSLLRSQRELPLENLVLRQQLAVLKQRRSGPCRSDVDRLFWVLLSSVRSGWRKCLHIAQPETVIRWHRQGFQNYWRWKSRGHGWPKIAPEIRHLVQRMCRANPLWGAPRSHGELLKLGVNVSEATVSKCMIRRFGPPSQTWRAFLDKLARDPIALDFFAVPTATFRILFVLIVLSHDRRRILQFNVTAHPTAVWTGRQLLGACGIGESPRFLLRDRDAIYGAEFRRQVAAPDIEAIMTVPRSPWQKPYAERVIGSLRRECLDHTLILSDLHLKRVLASYAELYHSVRTRLSLEKDAPLGRSIQLPELRKNHRAEARWRAPTRICPHGCVDWHTDDYLGRTGVYANFTRFSSTKEQLPQGPCALAELTRAVGELACEGRACS